MRSLGTGNWQQKPFAMCEIFKFEMFAAKRLHRNAVGFLVSVSVVQNVRIVERIHSPSRTKTLFSGNERLLMWYAHIDADTNRTQPNKGRRVDCALGMNYLMRFFSLAPQRSGRERERFRFCVRVSGQRNRHTSTEPRRMRMETRKPKRTKRQRSGETCANASA